MWNLGVGSSHGSLPTEHWAPAPPSLPRAGGGVGGEGQNDLGVSLLPESPGLPLSVGWDNARNGDALGGVQPPGDAGEEWYWLSGGEAQVSQRQPERRPLSGELSANVHEFGPSPEFDNCVCASYIFKKES